jgi:hypothetical protein
LTTHAVLGASPPASTLASSLAASSAASELEASVLEGSISSSMWAGPASPSVSERCFDEHARLTEVTRARKNIAEIRMTINRNSVQGLALSASRGQDRSSWHASGSVSGAVHAAAGRTPSDLIASPYHV